LIGKLQQALTGYEADPGNASLAAATFQAAKSLAQGLNAASGAVQDTRRAADQAMQSSVSNINALLAQFKVANDAVVRGGGTPSELADNLDSRDRILKQLSDEIGIRTITRPNNDIAIYTDSGATLFEAVPRTVSLAPTDTFTAGTSGNPVMVDGVRLTGDATVMGGKSGKLIGAAQVRDGLAVTYQKQLDEVARGLISQFAESDQGNPPSQPQVPGLFTAAGVSGIPAQGTAGLAASISANSLADPSAGGNPSLIRDGGFGSAAYVANATGAAGFQGRISQLVAALSAQTSFDPSAQLGATGSLVSFSAQASGWVEAQRQQASASSDADQAAKTRANDALQRVTGVNIDEEMATMLDLEKAYQASAKVMTAVDGMLQDLLQAVGR
jgi:flagellar hook-associated protein 1 FlgK